MKAWMDGIEVLVVRASEHFAIVNHPKYALPIRVERNSLVF